MTLDFPVPTVTSLGYDGCWMEPPGGIVPRCQELRSKSLHAWELCLPSLFVMYSHLFPIQALNFILMYRSLIQSYFCICSVLVACISMILILQVLCWCPDICIGWQLQHWQGLELGPASVGEARPSMLLQHLKLSPALRSSKMRFSLGLKSKEEAEVQLGSGLCPPGLSSRLACEKANAWCWGSSAFPLMGPFPWKDTK